METSQQHRLPHYPEVFRFSQCQTWPDKPAEDNGSIASVLRSMLLASHCVQTAYMKHRSHLYHVAQTWAEGWTKSQLLPSFYHPPTEAYVDWDEGHTSVLINPQGLENQWNGGISIYVISTMEVTWLLIRGLFQFFLPFPCFLEKHSGQYEYSDVRCNNNLTVEKHTWKAFCPWYFSTLISSFRKENALSSVNLFFFFLCVEIQRKVSLSLHVWELLQ